MDRSRRSRNVIFYFHSFLFFFSVTLPRSHCSSFICISQRSSYLSEEQACARSFLWTSKSNYHRHCRFWTRLLHFLVFHNLSMQPCTFSNIISFYLWLIFTYSCLIDYTFKFVKSFSHIPMLLAKDSG